MRVLHACEALGREAVHTFFPAISESSRRWMMRIALQDEPPVQLAA